MIEYVRFAIVFVGTATVASGLYRQTFLPFDRIINLTATLIVINAAHFWFASFFLIDNFSFNVGAPYGLMYGPLLLFALFFSQGKRVTWRSLIIHSIPFSLSYIFFILIIAFPRFRLVALNTYLEVLYFLMPGSLLIYAFYVSFLKGTGVKGELRRKQKLIYCAGMILLVTAGILYNVKFTDWKQQQSIADVELIIHLMMVVTSCILFVYNILKFEKETHGRKLAVDKSTLDKGKGCRPYEKSLVQEEILQEYENKLLYLLETKKVYLDPELNSAKIAAELKITAHHLSQVVNFRFGRNFKQLINSYRVEHAAQLILQDREHLNLEELAMNSGFSSRISFHRNFKNEKKCSPSEFRVEIRSQSMVDVAN